MWISGKERDKIISQFLPLKNDFIFHLDHKKIEETAEMKNVGKWMHRVKKMQAKEWNHNF